ncbi:DUF317 domain-containing protein [Streptomyces sp. CS7]|uniref:DUF317 domain-containing protein n=1 Tax=Streptomyces sp. CS-7 TaxID=2906769 RepID=UPI0021B41534|nr:DUF317 domain-containing protein [Streptomyces sp. CS-7]MCT6780454.1 DUF317 domain-containing protein [Streptomyces sp. CS-7]
MTRFAPDELVLVSPRHLAGAGVDKIRDALGLLINMFGWTAEKLPPAGHVLLNSPGGEMVLDFTPDRQDSVWWTIAHHEPFWHAEFTRQVPVETIAAVTQTLPQVLGDDRYADRIPSANEYPASIAKGRGWAIQSAAHGTTWTSPDGHCKVEHTADTEHTWRFTHSVHDGFETDWSAVFTVDTPTQVVAQFVTHLSDERPVERRFTDVPAAALDAAVVTPVRNSGPSTHTLHPVERLGHSLTSTGRSPGAHRRR